MRQIEDLLRRHIGLDAATIGSALIERTVRLRMEQHGVKKTDTYRGMLATSRQELEQLIEAVVVTETWFFRDREPFNVFTQMVLRDWQAHARAGKYRILSMPCSTGEEPYSLAMALLDAGVPESDFAIDAVDISANALTRAEQAVYGKNSFRGRELGFRDRHFFPTKEGYALSPLVRRCVRFERGNVLDDGFLAGSTPYDLVFCRNLLIYFDRATQILVLARLHQLLADHGVLFVGPAELPLAVGSGFVNAGVPMAFACHKPTRDIVPLGTPRPRLWPELPAEPPLRRRPKVQIPTLAKGLVDLEVARQYADAGRLAEAASICHAHLTGEGPAAQAYYLLGLVKDAGNDPEAIAFYRKALYLEPNHYEALVHITLALEKSGEVNAARLYQRRAQRAQPKS